MLPKIIIIVLVGLHILPVSLLNAITPINTPKPTPIEIRTPIAGKLGTNDLSIADEVYADLAMQHELDHVSVYYFDDNPKNTISINADKNWDPASTIKLYAAMYTFDQVSHGKISLDQNVVIDSKNVAASQSYPSGYSTLNANDNVTVYRLIDQMITQSDNTAFNTLLDLLDRQEITKYVHDLGLTNSSVGAKLNLNPNQQSYEGSVSGYGQNLITANDYAKAFILINGGRIPGSTDLFNILSRQKLNDMLPSLLPQGVIVAHKPGELDPYYHDGGIVSGPNRRYVLSIFSDLGDPGIVAHISQLVYTNDVNLVGNNAPSKTTSEIPNAPIDPLVSLGESQQAVLGLNTQIINLPKVTASDVGIQAKDLVNTLDSKQLPPVIIPPSSRFHVLVALGEQIRVLTNPNPLVKATLKAENLKQDLSDANNLIANGKKDEANTILRSIDNKLAQIAQDPSIAKNKNVQSSIDAVSETRFSILGKEVNASQNTDEKIQIIKQIASQAANTTENVKPYVTDSIKQTSLSQAPVVGQVVSTTANSVTIKTSDGTEIKTPLDSQIKTRSVDENNSEVSNPKSLTVGSTIAVAGSFVLTNIDAGSANPQPVTVLKVNPDTNTIVIQAGNGIPQQIDLTKTTVIKGIDTSISLDQVKAGDVIVVHGEPLPATPSASLATSTPSSSGNSTPSATTSTTSISPGSGNTNNQPQNTSSPVATIASKTISPSATPVPTSTTSNKATITPATPTPTKTTTPTVIKGNVIQVVPTTNKSSTAPAPATTPAPTTAPAPTVAPKKK